MQIWQITKILLLGDFFILNKRKKIQNNARHFRFVGVCVCKTFFWAIFENFSNILTFVKLHTQEKGNRKKRQTHLRKH